MKKTILSILLLGQCCAMSAQDSLWVRYDNRFQKNVGASIANADSIEMKVAQVKVYTPTGTKTISASPSKSTILLANPGRYLLKPSTYSGTNYENQNATSGYNFAHSLESEHFAVFWDVRYGNNPDKIQYPGDGNVAKASDVLDIAEKCW